MNLFLIRKGGLVFVLLFSINYYLASLLVFIMKSPTDPLLITFQLVVVQLAIYKVIEKQGQVNS